MRQSGTDGPDPAMLVPIRTAAELADCTEATVLDLISAGRVASRRINRKLYVDLDALTDAVNDKREAS